MSDSSVISSRAHLLGHAAGATATLLVLRQTDVLLGWISGQVSWLSGTGGGIYSVTVSADTSVAAFLASTLVAAVSLVAIGALAETTELVRRRWGYVAMVPASVAALLGGFALSWLTRGDDVQATAASLIAVSPALLLLLLTAIYWTNLVAVPHMLRRAVHSQAA